MAAKGGSGNSNRRRKPKKKPKVHGGPPKKELIARHLEYDKTAKEAANNRFNLLPLPIVIQRILQLQGTSVSIGKIILYHSKLNLYLLAKW